MQRFAETGRKPQGQLFLSQGELDDGQVQLEELAARLGARGYDKLDITTAIFEGETHNSGSPVTLSRGLRAVYELAQPHFPRGPRLGDWNPPSSPLRALEQQARRAPRARSAAS